MHHRWLNFPQRVIPVHEFSKCIIVISKLVRVSNSPIMSQIGLTFMQITPALFVSREEKIDLYH
jgi:hypothetical protein